MPITLDDTQTNAGNPVVGYADWSDAATLSSTAAVEGTNDVTKLQDDQPSAIASLNAASTVTIIADRGESDPWNAIMLLFHNLTSAATWRVRSADTLGALTSSPQVDSGDMIAWGNADYRRWTRRHSWWFPAVPLGGPVVPDGISSQFIRLDINDPTNPDGFVRIGRLVAGLFWQPARAQSIGRSFGFTDKSKIVDTVSGHKHATAVELRPVQKFTIALLDEDALMDFSYELTRLRGASRSVVVMVRPAITAHAHRNLTYGLLTLGPQSKEADFRQYEQVFDIEGMP